MLYHICSILWQHRLEKGKEKFKMKVILFCPYMFLSILRKRWQRTHSCPMRNLWLAGTLENKPKESLFKQDVPLTHFLILNDALLYSHELAAACIEKQKSSSGHAIAIVRSMDARNYRDVKRMPRTWCGIGTYCEWFSLHIQCRFSSWWGIWTNKLLWFDIMQYLCLRRSWLTACC